MNLFNNPFPPEVFAYFSPRAVDFTLPKELDEMPLAQKDYLRKAEGVAPEQIYYGRQVHGKEIVVVTEKDVPLAMPIRQADGFVTNVKGIALAVRTADCLPIFLYDPIQKAIGMIHAGWKGTEQKIAVAAIETMQREYGTEVAYVKVAFGPCIRRCCYEVGPEFGEKFPDETFLRWGKYFFDLALANRNQLMSLGVPEANFLDEEKCTDCEDDLFSHRREGEAAGRHLSFMMLGK